LEVIKLKPIEIIKQKVKTPSSEGKQMRGLIVKVSNEGNLIYLYVRGEDGKKYKLTITDFKPYFYVEDPSGSYTSIDGKRLRRIKVDRPGDVPEVRSQFSKHYEADIRYTQRFLIDTGLYSGVEFPTSNTISYQLLRPCESTAKPVLAYFDIEAATYDTNSPIICFTLYLPKSNKFVSGVWREDLKKYHERVDNWHIFYYNNEKDLLLLFLKCVQAINFDILAGYNIDNYDLPHLLSRLRYHNLKLEQTFENFDIYLAYRTLFDREESYRLKDVVINEKITVPNEVEEFDEFWWEGNLKKLLEYNKKDVWWVYQLDRKHHLSEYFTMKKEISGLACYNDLHSNINVFNQHPAIDVMCLREARENNVILPSSEVREVEKYEGAFVLEPPEGVVNNVAFFDFSRYYPSIILSFNIEPIILHNYYKSHKIFSIEKYIKFAREWIIQNKPLILINVIKKLMKMRAYVETELAEEKPGTERCNRLKSMRQAVKGLINSIYGLLGYKKFRLLMPELASMVPTIGREGIRYLIRFTEGHTNFRIIYSDTDSIAVQIPFEVCEQFEQTLTREINNYFSSKYGIQTNIKMKFERYCPTVYFKTKKRYAMHVTYEDGKECDYIDFKGLEVIRRDESVFTKELLTELFEIILRQKNVDLTKWLIQKIKEFKQLPIEKIVIPQSFSKPLHQYKNKDAAVRGAIYASLHLDCNTDMSKVYMLYVKRIPGKPKTDVIAVDDTNKIPKDIIIDWQRMIERSIVGKVEDIFRNLGVPIIYHPQQTTLF